MKATSVLIIFQIILANTSVILGYKTNSTILSRFSRGTCTELQWKCKNGDCIENYEKCDGTVNCKDKSDETHALCATIRCPDYAFRCTYGGCISGTDICNGRRDCADNSDELLVTCPGVKEKLNPVGKCEKGLLQCGSGECISTDIFCDGTNDCKDNSDETLERCASTYCPSFSFRCAYGGCVGGNSKCNDILDCADGSDESEALCGRPFFIPTTTAAPAVIVVPEGSCVVPQFPKSGRFVQDVLKPTEDIILPGDIIPNFSPVSVVCDPNYNLTGADVITCIDGEWDSEFPTCSGEKTCSEIAINGLTVIPQCILNGKDVSCQKPIPLKTKVEITCKMGYGTPNRVIQTLYCVDGSWSAEVKRCEVDCGTVTQQGQSYVSGGKDADVAEVPWHAGIYTNRTKDAAGNNEWKQICGGTILTERIVISAAHCFWNVEEKKFYKPKYHKVGLGKFYRDYNAVEAYTTQYLNVKDIVTKERYQHLDGLYNYDIAVLVLSNFIVFKPNIRPICLNYGAKTSFDKTVQANKVGKVSGWGYTENDTIAINLKVVDLPTVDYTTCYNRVSDSYKPFVNVGDKFCAGSPEKAVSVCQGDSGGGLVFKETLNGEERYYLRGIVSSGPLYLTRICDTKQYVLFTNVLDYLEMIDDVVRQLIFSGGDGLIDVRQGTSK